MKTLLFLTILLYCSSCALLFQGTKKDVTVKSITPNAAIYIDGEKKGSDLVVAQLARKTNHTIIVKKDGCSTETLEVQKHVQVGWVVFDLLVNWFAFLTDPTTGAWNTFDKDNYSVDLDCKGGAVTNVTN
jgi:hypothetical protein